MKAIILTILSFFWIIPFYGQMDADNIDFRSSIYDPNANFYSIKNSAETFYLANPSTDEGAGYSEYSRWAWYWKNKVDDITGLNPGSFKSSRI